MTYSLSSGVHSWNEVCHAKSKRLLINSELQTRDTSLKRLSPSRMVGYFLRLFSLNVKLTLTLLLFSSLCACFVDIFVDECLVELYLFSAGVSIDVQPALLNLSLSCIIFFIVFINLSATFAWVCVTMCCMPSSSNNFLTTDWNAHHCLNKWTLENQSF